MRLAEHESGADGERRLAPREELLALDVEFCVEYIVLRVMLELRERRRRALGIRDHDLPRARLRSERYDDASELFVAHELAPIEPHDRVLHLLAALVEHGEQVAARPSVLQHLPLPHAHERAAAAPAAYELHNPRAALAGERGELECLPCALERPAVKRVRLLTIRDEAVEIEVGVELAVLREEKIERIHLVDPHDDFRRVFHDDIELHVVSRGVAILRLEELRIRRGKLDVHALLQALKFGRRDQRRPLLRIAMPACDERLGEHGLQPGAAHVVREGHHHSHADVAESDRRGALENIDEKIAHERLIVADGPVLEQRLGEVGVQVGCGLALKRFLQPLRIHVARLPREFQILHEACLIIYALLPIVIEAAVKDVRLLRVERGWQRLRIGPQPLQPSLARGGVELDIHIRRRREFAHLRKDKRAVAFERERRRELRQRIELLRQERAVDAKLAEPARLLRLQIRRDQLDQPRHIGPLQPSEQRAPPVLIKRDSVFHQRLQRLLGKRSEPRIMRDRIALEDLACHTFRIERSREIRLFVAHFLHVVELQAEPLAQKFQRLLRVCVVAQHRLAVLDDLPPTGIPEALLPLRHDVCELRRIARILEMQGVVKIIVLRAGDEFAEHLCAVWREREFLDEAGLILRPGADGQDQRGDERECCREVERGASVHRMTGLLGS